MKTRTKKTMTNKYYLSIYDNEPYFFCGYILPNFKHVIHTKTLVGDIKEDGYEIHVTGESFNKFGYYVRTREYMIVEDKPVEISEKQFNMFKKEILKIQNLKDVFNITATALYNVKSNASRTDKKGSD